MEFVFEIKTMHHSEMEMFYGATKETFQFAKELRSNLTNAEKILWGKLRNKKLGVKFRRQHPIDRFIVDFIAPEAKLIVEIDGPIHERIQEQDQTRQNRLEEMGYRVIRFPNEEVLRSPESVLGKITELPDK